MTLGTEEKAQAGIEYLLIIAGAVIMAIVIGLYLKSIPGQTENKVNEGFENVIHGF